MQKLGARHAEIEDGLMALHIPACTLWQRITCLAERTITNLPIRQLQHINTRCVNNGKMQIAVSLNGAMR